MTDSTRLVRRQTSALSNRHRPIIVEIEGRVLRFREKRTRQAYTLDVESAWRFAVAAELERRKADKRKCKIRGNRR